LAVAGALLAGCSSGPVARARGSFEILGEAEAVALPAGTKRGTAVETGERIDHVPARARAPLAQPEYPAAALAGGAGDYTLYVTFTVDERGRVGDVAPSWNRIQPPNRFAEEFLTAAKTALATWSLEPAMNVYWNRGPDGEDAYLRTETMAERVEVKFVFDAEPARR
jgi:hypothetical protein